MKHLLIIENVSDARIEVDLATTPRRGETIILDSVRSLPGVVYVASSVVHTEDCPVVHVWCIAESLPTGIERPAPAVSDIPKMLRERDDRAKRVISQLESVDRTVLYGLTAEQHAKVGQLVAGLD